MSNLKNTLPGTPGNETAWINDRTQVRPYIRPTYYPAVSGGESVIRLSLGKLWVNQLQVVKRTNTPLNSLTGSQCVCCTCSFSHHVTPCAVRTTGLYEHNRILPKMSVTHYQLPVVCTFIFHQNGYPVAKSRTRR